MPDTVIPPQATPWGTPDHTVQVDAGIYLYSTPSHGGFWLDPTRNGAVHPAWRRPDAFYEEDCAAAIVVFTYPAAFTADMHDHATRTLINFYPDEYELITGAIIEPGTSLKKDRAAFLAAHARQWIVISAAPLRPGFVECVATLGARRDDGAERRRYLVAADEYDRRGPHGFVIDESRHVRQVTRADLARKPPS